MVRLAVLAALTVVGCTCGEKPQPPCVDADGDGVDSCSDCDDGNPSRAPGRTEVCDQLDNDCDGTADEGGVCACTPGQAPTACGANGSCERACLSTGQLGECLPPGATMVDTRTDPRHCGQCGATCPAPVNAAARCANGVCGRGPCQPGFFDVDGPATFGCESTCAARQCSLPDGGVLAVHHDPLPEAGGVFHTFSSGGSFGDQVQTNSQFTNFGVFGQGVPQAQNGQVEASGGAYRHLGGFTPVAQ